MGSLQFWECVQAYVSTVRSSFTDGFLKNVLKQAIVINYIIPEESYS